METFRLEIRILSVLMLWVFMFTSCKKDSSEHIIPAPVYEHVEAIHGLKGGLNEFMETYHYDDRRLQEYLIYRPGKDDEWQEWLKYSYSYPSENEIIETRHGTADSIWFPANRNEKRFLGGQMEEIVHYDYDEGYPGKWRPVKKIIWTFEGNRIMQRMTYTWPDNGWEEHIRSDYEYTGPYWTGMKSFRNNNGIWDTAGCVVLLYSGGRLNEVQTYECRDPGGWILSEKYLLSYDGMLLAEMVININSGDSLEWERSLFVDYSEYGSPSKYTIDYACCPTEEIIMSYEEGIGNFRQATQGYSNYIIWPWFPAPVK